MMNKSIILKNLLGCMVLVCVINQSTAETIVLQNGLNGYGNATDFLLWHFTATDLSPHLTMNFNEKTMNPQGRCPFRGVRPSPKGG